MAGYCDAGSNTLSIQFGTSTFSEHELEIIRKRCNALVRETMLVEHLRIERESASSPYCAVIFTTIFPEELWRRIWADLYEEPKLGGRLKQLSMAFWKGEVCEDSAPIHPPKSPGDRFDAGFKGRHNCGVCDHYFYFHGYVPPGRCPNCHAEIKALGEEAGH